MNVNTKFSAAQFPTYAAGNQSSVIKGKHAGAAKAKAAQPVQAASDAPAEGVITDDEKQFFETLFPAASQEIRSYSPYSRNGVRPSAALGSLVDRKG